jgi:hypothetical protein
MKTHLASQYHPPFKQKNQGSIGDMVDFIFGNREYKISLGHFLCKEVFQD